MEKYFFTGLVKLFLLVTVPMNTIIAGSDMQAFVSSPSGKDTVFLGESTQKYVKFLGIRYGEQPTGDKRFMKSAIYTYESSTVVAKKHGNVCPQSRHGNTLITSSDTMGEDCLFLNIFVPLDNYSETRSTLNVTDFAHKKAVYIFIHGGVFLRGSSNLYDSTAFVTQGDFILVTINYRLGVLGFLSTNDGVLPANLGLWDQQLAIRWVKQNIEAFGGDQSRITIGGQSAGSISAVLHSFHEGNDDLFQSTIAESGTSMALKFVSEHGRPVTMEFAKTAGCKMTLTGEELSKEIRKCLKEKTVTELISLGTPSGNLGPVLDNDFITKETFKFTPQNIKDFKTHASIPPTFAKKNLLIGFNSDDGEIMYQLFIAKLANAIGVVNVKEYVARPIAQGIFRLFIKHAVFDNNAKDPVAEKAIEDAIVEYYTDWSQPSKKAAVSRSAVKMFTDITFALPAIYTARVHSAAKSSCGQTKACPNSTGSTYMYEFRLPIGSPLATVSDLPWFHGTRHGAELYFLSKLFVRNTGLSDLMKASWSNFIKTGNPNSAGSTIWKEYTTESKAMFLLSDDPKLVSGTHAKDKHFWEDYLPTLQDAFYHSSNQNKKCGDGNNGGLALDSRKYIILLVVSVVIALGKCNF